MLDFNALKVDPKININLGNKKRGKRIGILNKGKGTKILNSEFSNLDVAIQNEGEDMLAKDNKIK